MTTLETLRQIEFEIKNQIVPRQEMYHLDPDAKIEQRWMNAGFESAAQIVARKIKKLELEAINNGQ